MMPKNKLQGLQEQLYEAEKALFFFSNLDHRLGVEQSKLKIEQLKAEIAREEEACQI